MRCPNCQSAIPDDSKFCTVCGREIVTRPSSARKGFCQACGAPLDEGTNFCINCGTPVHLLRHPSETPAAVNTAPNKKKRKSSFSSSIKFACIVACFILIDCMILFVILKDAVALKKTAAAEADYVNSQLSAVSEQITDAEAKLLEDDYPAAALALSEALSMYSDIENYPQSTAPLHADEVFASYSQTLIRLAAELESQPVSGDTYKQVSNLLSDSLSHTAQLSGDASSALLECKDSLSSTYKEKYIVLFNDLRNSEEWSFDTAWQYMQDADTAGLLPGDEPDDPLTLRYAYALAGVTHQELIEGLNDNSLSCNDAVSRITSVIKTADYNPVLMIDLARCLETVDNTQKAEIVMSACRDVYGHLAYTENIYIDPEDFMIDGKSSSNASSTIALADFYYFNDFGEYSISNINGLSPEGRQFIRSTFENAVNSL